MLSKVNPDIKRYIEENIIPQYGAFDLAHSFDHVGHVIRKSVDLAARMNVDIDKAYVVAAYHDLGMSGPRESHHILSGEIISNDMALRCWFSDDDIRQMKEAVEDHRASACHEPRNIYGKIVADADRDLTPSTVIRRTIQYGLSHYPEKSREEQFRRMAGHLREKYSASGYLHLYFSESDNRDDLKELRRIIDNPSLLRQLFDKTFDDLTGNTYD